MKREDYERELEKEKGKEYLEQNKGLLDDQWEYIESLGDPEDNNPDQNNGDFIFSDPNPWKIDASGIILEEINLKTTWILILTAGK